MQETPSPASKVGFWHRIPLTSRLVITFITLLSTGLVITAMSVLGILQSHLVNQVDNELNSAARQLISTDATNSYAKRSLIDNSASILPSNYFLRIHLKNEAPRDFASPLTSNIGRPSARALQRIDEVTKSGITAPVTISGDSGGVSWRALVIPIVDYSTHAELGTLTIALPLANMAETMTNTVYYVLASSVVLIGAGALAAWVLIAYSLHPLKEIEKVAGKVSTGTLGQRITTMEGPNTEVGSLTRSLNRMLARLETAFDAQARSEAKMRQFVSDASHELRTPLSVIKGYAELYRMGAVPASEVPSRMESIENQAKRMGELVESLLKLARLDEGRMITMGECDLYRLGRYALSDALALDPTRPVRLLRCDGSELEEGEELPVYADQSQLSQVLNNLIGNVHRYTDTNVPVEILLGVTSDPGVCAEAGPGREQVVIEVRDHGAGVPASEHERLFERFYRSDASRTRDTGGTGLGLSIVYAVASVHGGRARAWETAGGGLTVQVAFPYRTAQMVELATRAQLEAPGPSEGEAGTGEATTKAVGAEAEPGAEPRVRGDGAVMGVGKESAQG